MKKIALTGGGTAGHVTPNIALMPGLIGRGYEIIYIGSKSGMEKGLIENNNVAKIPYFGISSGKLRRYLDIKNLTDIFRVVRGLGDAYSVLRKQKPDIVFSKGGFVTVPVVIAAKLCGIPVVIHESDISPGLANKIAIPFATAICISFPETAQKLKRAVPTGAPVRTELLSGSKLQGLKLCEFDGAKPAVLFMGGSSGSVKLNSGLRGILPELLEEMNVAHICGRGNTDGGINHKGYRQFEYVTDELKHLFAMADLVVSRAGANTIFELLALGKPNLLVPLSKNASRGDQIANAASFEAQGFSMVLPEEDLSGDTLLSGIMELYEKRAAYIGRMKAGTVKDGVSGIIDVIEQTTAGKSRETKKS